MEYLNLYTDCEKFRKTIDITAIRYISLIVKSGRPSKDLKNKITALCREYDPEFSISKRRSEFSRIEERIALKSNYLSEEEKELVKYFSYRTSSLVPGQEKWKI